MGVLDQITKMKRQGIPEDEIANSLREQGVSPAEINDAMKQAQIKNAISDNDDMGNEMQPSMMEGKEIPAPIEQEEYNPQPAQTYQPNVYEAQAPQEYQQQAYQPQEQQQQYYQPQEQQQAYQPQEQQQQYYPPETGYAAPAAEATNADMVIEIADQLFSEKVKKLQKQLESTSETSSLLQTKVENISDRLKKIETIIDKLQIAILEKVGSYGQNLGDIKKEMSMMQDSFSKMVSPKKEEKKSESKK